MRHGHPAGPPVGHPAAWILCLVLCLCAGCSGPLYTNYDPNLVGEVFHPSGFQLQGFAIDRLGVCGPMSSDAADMFIYGGYLAADLGEDASACLDKAAAQKLRFVAIIEKARPDSKSLGLEQDYDILVLDTRTGNPLWRADGEEGPGGARIRRSATLELAFRDMVHAFSKTYPPAPRTVAQQEPGPRP